MSIFSKELLLLARCCNSVGTEYVEIQRNTIQSDKNRISLGTSNITVYNIAISIRQAFTYV